MRGLLRVIASTLALAGAIGAAWAAPFAYVPNHGSSTVSVIDTATRAVVGTVPTGPGSMPSGVAVDAQGARVYVTSPPDTLITIDAATTSVVSTVTMAATQVAASPASTRVYVTGGTFVSVVDATTGTVTATIPACFSPQGVAVNRTETRAYVACFAESAVAVLDTVQNQLLAKVPVGAQPRHIALSPDGTRVYVTTGSSVDVISAATQTVVAQIAVPNAQLGGVASSPDGTRVYVAKAKVTPTGSDELLVVDTSSYAIAGHVAVGKGPTGVAVTPDSRQIYVSDNLDDTVSIVDATSQAVVAVVPCRPLAGRDRSVHRPRLRTRERGGSDSGRFQSRGDRPRGRRRCHRRGARPARREDVMPGGPHMLRRYCPPTSKSALVICPREHTRTVLTSSSNTLPLAMTT